MPAASTAPASSRGMKKRPCSVRGGLFRLCRFFLGDLRRRCRGSDGIHFYEPAAQEPIDARTRAAVKSENRCAIASRRTADLNRRRLAGARHHVTFAHAKPNAAIHDQGRGVAAGGRRGRCWPRARSGSRCGSRSSNRSRTRTIGIDQIVRRDRALVLFGLGKLGKAIARAAAADVEGFGKPGLATAHVAAAAGKRDGRESRKNDQAMSPNQHPTIP